ncbi:DUF2917 domain-containing protein [Xylophilus ampelinus]|uniref:DUF2917 family protein n=1 Tax=Xylophilus ampelinus TaxID=54067 RepID=A0A318SGH0_9BURK|nr:DUF2917 domain-containing protein [Xylophilus ampelinus]MCS4510467.1 DUF2917 domain-containing protein [Xylophilus ampelinus]PYE77923.1 hypothetical protein DFQ15_11167 [Xylophilus ampelinus]
MHHPTLLGKQQCQTVEAGRAVAIRAACAGVLRIRSGGAWITLDGGGRSCGGPRPRGGDWFLMPGESFPLPRGGRIVLEPRSAGEAVGFEWSPGRGAAGDVARQAAQVARQWRRVCLAGWRFGRALAALAAGLLCRRPGPAQARECRPSHPS